MPEQKKKIIDGLHTIDRWKNDIVNLLQSRGADFGENPTLEMISAAIVYSTPEQDYSPSLR